MKLNQNYRQLQDSYLFTDIGRRVAAYTAAHPDQRVIRLGIGDVTRPLCPAVVQAMHAAVDDQAEAARFHGYGPEQGYPFLREAIAVYYAEQGVRLSPDEIFVGDGAKSDLGNLLDLCSADCTVLIPNPVYPAYLDANLMQGRTVRYIDANVSNAFLPLPDETQDADLIYLCSPNNPTGAVYHREQLAAWVEYARRKDALLLFDAAYEAFVHDPALPRSIYSIPGADKCAVEFCSLSKTAGFTGVRCGYTVVPKALEYDGVSLAQWWLRRQTTKFNGVSYVTQKGAAAVFTPEGRRQTAENLAVYMCNARAIAQGLSALGIWFTGGVDSPYIWFQCPGGMSSWDCFDLLLHQAGVVGTPGVGFGSNGEGFFRLTGFGDPADTREAVERLRRVFGGR